MRCSPIAVGEEITVSYGETHHQGRLPAAAAQGDASAGCSLRHAVRPGRKPALRDNCLMNPLLARLHPYPFERLKELTRSVVASRAHAPISLGIGEPRHATPELIERALVDALPTLSSYPATAGEPALREAFAGWVQRRYGVGLNPSTQTLPVNGSREALFALAQTVIDPTRAGATVVCPNPFYQDLRRRGAAGRCADSLCQQRPGAQLRCRLVADRRRHLGAHATAVCLLAWQPDRCGNAAGRVEDAVRVERPTWLRHCQ